MPLFLIVSEIYNITIYKAHNVRKKLNLRLKYRNGEKFEIFSKFLAHPVETPSLTDLDGSTPECAQVCALHTGPHLASL